MVRHRKPIDPIPPHLAGIVKSEPHGSVTYFAEDTATGHVKIGYSWRPRLMERIRELERELKRPVRLLAVVHGGREVEKGYHQRLAADREHHEWFRPSPPVMACITEANAPTWTPDGATYWHEWAGLL